MITLWGARDKLRVLFFLAWKKETVMYIQVSEKGHKGKGGKIEELTRPS